MKLHRFSKISLIARDLNVGDVVPVGDDAQGLYIDKIPEPLARAFDEMREIVRQRANDAGNAKLLKQKNIPMSQMLFTHLFVFTKKMAELFPDLKGKDERARQDLYLHSPNMTVKLSELFDKKMFMCAEYSAIAQMYLQSVGIDSEFIAGGMFARNDTVARCVEKNVPVMDNPHAYILIRENGTTFVFDPTRNCILENPATKTQSQLPNIFTVDLTPKQKVAFRGRLLSGKRKVAFFEARNIITGRPEFYGYGDKAPITSDMIFMAEKPDMQNALGRDWSRD